MEVSVIGCMPHVQVGNNSVASQPYEGTSFICVPETAAVNACQSQECDDHNIILIENKDTEPCETDEITLDMRVETEDVLSSIPVVAESINHVKDICSGTDVITSVPAILPNTISHTSLDISSSVTNASDVSSNESYISSSSIPDPPKKKKRYLFLFRPNINKILVKTKNGNSYRCYVCGGIYRQKFSLKRHYLRSHVDFRYISEADIANCKIPIPNYANEKYSSIEKKTSNGRKKFKKSVNDVFLENNDSGLMPGLYRCHDCSGVFCNTESELRDHYNKHPDSVKKKFQCHICDASFFKKQILSRHLAGHGEKVTKSMCKRCNIEFSSKAEYQKHLASHSSGRKCKYCSKILSTSANRKRHESLHEGLKTFRCSHCDASFAQRKDLDRHLRKQHSEICRVCSLCNKVFPSQDNLAVHMREKHTGSPKMLENSNNCGDVDRSNISKTTVRPVPKANICIVCRRSFPSPFAMLQHKRKAHPFYSRRKRHKRNIKKKIKSEISNNFKRPYTKSPKPVRSSGRPPKQNGQAGEKPTKEAEKGSIKLEEAKFYNKVHKNIADNLTNYIDGRASQLSLKEYHFNDLQDSFSNFEECVRYPWSHYNFPHWFDVDTALKVKGHEIKRPENMSVQDELLYEATGLTPVNLCTTVDNETQSSIHEMDTVVITTDDHKQNENLNLQEKKIVGKNIISVILCYVCREKLDSREAFNEHCINNHPNVDCSYLEIEGDEKSPPVIPPELLRVDVSSTGFRFSCNVPPRLSEGSVKCTKCLLQFKTGSELHDHITVCGDLVNPSSTYVWRKNSQRRIKRTMKKRMTLAQQQAALEASSVFKTPEKRESITNNATKSSDRATRYEKLQFYKNGRLQTKSLTVDKNYFNTKPTKPVKSVSKRGRKSYAIVSSMYRNATMQPSTSRECSDCGVVFASVQALNNHLKNPCSGQLLQEKNKLKIQKSASKSETDSKPCMENSSYSNTLVNKQNGPEFLIGNNRSTNCFTTSETSRSHANVLPVVPNRNFQINRSNNSEVKDLLLSTSYKGSDQRNLPADVEQLSDAPMDLSRNSNDSSLTFNQSNVCISKKSALELAMEAVREYSQSSEFEQTTRNTHISKLQETVDKLATRTQFVSPLPTSVTVKRVGRPRKIKKLAGSATLVFENKFSSDLNAKNIPAISKPSKLEEAVKRLKENKIRSEEERQKNLIRGQVSVSENSKNNTLLSSNSQSSDISNITFVQSDQNTNNKENSDNLSADNVGHESISTNNTLCTADYNSSIDVPEFERPDVSSQNVHILSGKDSGNSDISCNEERTASTEASDKPVHLNNILIQKDVENEKNTEDLDAASNSEFPVAEHSDKVNQGANSHGRTSPTFESILKVINQKLHSEQESSQQDDSAISWLEDEKFEIPPSRSKLNLIVPNSNAELSADSEKSIIPPDLCVTKGQDTKTNMTPVSVQVPLDKTQEVLESTSSSNSAPEKIPSVLEGKIHSPTEVVENSETPSVTASAITSVNSTANVRTEHSDVPEVSDKGKSSILLIDTSPPSTMKISNSINRPLGRRGPGRPRKKLVDVDEVITTNAKNETFNTTLSNSNIDLPPIPNTEAVASVQTDTSLNSSDATKDTCFLETNSVEANADLPQTNKESALDTESGDLQTLTSLNVAEADKLSNQMDNELLPSVSLRNFRSKSKQIQNSNNNNNGNLKSTSTIKCSITTEFGKNLASRMKEKMRLSFENDSSKTLVRTEESNTSTCTETSDTTSQTSNEDNKLMKIVKKECEAAELTKIHFCPYCMLEFAYLTNFRRHIKKCQTRFESKETEPIPGTPSTNLQHLPKKDEVDYSMLNLYRHQSRQTQMMKEVENTNKLIKKYECNDCHRIYLNLFSLMQHKLSSHKLSTPNSSEQNNPSASVGTAEVNDIVNTDSCANDMTSYSVQQESEGNIDESVDFSSNIDTQISESTDKSICDPGISKSPSTVKEAFSQITNGANVALCVDSEDKNIDGIHEKKYIDRSLDLPDKSVKDEIINEKQPVKRKRGRPFGWRKNTSIVQEKVENKNTKKDFKAAEENNTVLCKKKAEKLQSVVSKNIIYSRIKDNARQVILDKMKKTLAEKSKMICMEKEECVSSAPNSVQNEKSSLNSSQNFISDSKEMLNIAPKSSVKDVSDTEDFRSVSGSIKDGSETFKNPSKLDKSAINNSLTGDANNSGKRGRGRPPVLSSKIPNKTSIKSELPQKRRPGRPPKNLLSTPGTSQSIKNVYSPPVSVRNLRKTAPVLTNADSSDSESEKMEPKTPLKKKVNLKICPLCKDKFPSSLMVHRHIQLVHSRRLEPTVSKPDLTNKIKKIVPKSPPVTNSESKNNISLKRDTPQKKTSNLKVCTICKKEFLTYLLLRNHQRIVHPKNHPESIAKTYRMTPSRRSESGAIKSGQLALSASISTSEGESDISIKRGDSPQKKSPNPKVCLLCKKKFSNDLLLRHHNQVSHGRKSNPVATKSEHLISNAKTSEPVSLKPGHQAVSPPVKINDRSFLSRQCRKPLPTLKRKRAKTVPIEQLVKKPKL